MDAERLLEFGVWNSRHCLRLTGDGLLDFEMPRHKTTNERPKSPGVQPVKFTGESVCRPPVVKS